jgi:autotransporter adhesin
VQENATGRGKKSSSRKLAVGSLMAIAALGEGLYGANAFAANGNGSLELCPGSGDVGYSYGMSSSTSIAGCAADAIGGSNPSFALINSGYTNGAGGWSSFTAGIVGNATGSLYLQGTSGINMVGTVLMGGNRITGLAAGQISSGSTDAVNGSQLYATNQNVANLTNVVNNLSGGSGSLKYFHANSALADSTARASESVAIGGAANASASNAVALGSNSVADRANTVSVGSSTAQRQIANMAAGTAATDAVNVSQLSGVTAALGGGASVKADGSIAQPTFNVYGQTYSNVGDALASINNNTSNLVQNLKYIKFGNSTAAAAQASGNDAVAIGGNAIASANGAVAIGRAALASAANAVAIGYGSQATDPNTFAVGNAFTPRRIVNVANGTAGARVLTGVAAGRVNASSLDAVNGTQLYNVAASTASAIGGGSTVKSDGTISNPTYVFNGGTTVTGIGGAITNLDARVYANSTDITNLQTQINNGGIGMVTQDDKSKNILVASKTDGSVVDFKNSAGAARVLEGVAAGVAATDAVNVGQLEAAGIISPGGKVKTAVTYDTDKDGTTNYSSITLGDGSSNAASVTIHNVAAGSQSTDAINYSQYADLVAKVNNITNAGTGVDTLFVGDGDRNTEAAQAGGSHATAMGALSVANGAQSVATGYAANASGQNAVAMGANAKASGNNSVALGAGSVADQDNTVSVGSATQQRRVTNVAAGTATTDAVNLGQLNDAIAQANASVDDKVNQGVQSANSYTNQQINNLDKKMNSLGAAAMAATSLIPNARAEGNFQMSAAAGTYGGAAAIAVGANYWVNDRVLVNAHVTRSTGYGASTGASVGATIGF